MKFAKIVYLIAGIYGLLGVVPNYFLENQNNQQFPPAITHPEYYYGFLGVALAWQIAFFIISRDPVRYRPLLITTVIEKFSFGIDNIILFALARATTFVLVFGLVDLVWGILFIICYFKLSGEEYKKS